jgi:hypothetical protein
MKESMMPFELEPTIVAVLTSVLAVRRRRVGRAKWPVVVWPA